MSIRTERLSREIVRILSQIIMREMNDPRMGFVTVVRARISPDLRTATVFLSILGSEKEQKLTFAAIQHARKFLQRNLGDGLGIRFTPELLLIHDRSVEKAIKMSQLLSEISTDKESDDGANEKEEE
ncbi:MAG: ribosome-binding factor A [Planctomycetes bacterium RBG_16_59_8]|nr:MAG: ribosome-binding factor A [Planctomycetes bacterium RBG_16_59_8]